MVKSISHTDNYSDSAIIHVVNRITKPSALKKVMQIGINAFKAIDLFYHVEPAKRKITDAMKGTIDFLEFHSTFKHALFWLNPLSKKTLDEKVLLTSLETANEAIKKKQAESIVKKVKKEMNKNSYTEDEVKEIITNHLTSGKYGYQLQAAELIAKSLKIEQKSRSIALLLSEVGFTFITLTKNILTLHRWNIFNLANLSAAIGSRSQVFAFVMKLESELIFGVVEAAALIAKFSDAAQRAYRNRLKIHAITDDESKEHITQELQTSILDLISFGFDFFQAALPLLIPLNPPVVIFFAIFAKGIGLICVNLVKIYQNISLKDHEKAIKEIRKSILSMISSGADFVNVAAPMAFSLSPPLVVALAIVAKGTGLLCIFAK